MKSFVYGLFAVALVLGAATSAAAQAQQYVVTAPGWGAAQAKAVAAAGGTVVFAHDGAGVAVVTSSAPDFLARIKKAPGITGAELDQMVQWTPNEGSGVTIEETFTNPPNDDRFFNTIQWAPQAIDAPAAWAEGCTGEGVRVAILDGGIYDGHPDLAANLDVASSFSFVPGQPFNNDTGTFWHGTHVAGIVAALDNDLGVIGIAPRATLVGVKVLHNGSGSFGWVIQGILYAATPIDQGGAGADIINMSLGAVFAKANGGGPLVAALNKAVNYANRFGVLVVSAAGNDGLDLQHEVNVISVPAQSGAGIAVSATGPFGFAYGKTDFDRPASYTNFGTSVINVSAPGGDFAWPTNELCTLPTTTAPVTIPCWAFDMVLSTSRAGYTWAAGTSMAAPAASAVAAMIKQRNPGISLGELKTRLQNSAIPTDPRNFHGHGWINALNACQQ